MSELPGRLRSVDPDDGVIVGLLDAAADEIERLRAVITEAIDRLTRHQPAERDVRHCGSCGFTWPCSSSWLRDDLSAALKGTTDDR